MPEKMKEIWKKHKFWLSIMSYALFLALVFLFGIHPLVKKIVITSDAIQEKIINDEIDQARIAKIPEMENALQSFNDKENDLNVILSENSEIDFIKKLEVMAENTNNKIDLKIDEKNPNVAVAAKSKDRESIINTFPSNKYIVAQINLEGGYSELINFIHKLENFSYYVSIISIDAIKTNPEKDNISSLNPFGNKITAQKIMPKNATIKSTILIAAYLKK